MGTQIPEGVTSQPAAADFSGLKNGGFRFAKLNAQGHVALCGAGERTNMLLDGDGAKQGEQTRYRNFPNMARAKAELGGTIAVNDQIASDATGRMVKATTGAHVLGRALEAGGVGLILAFQPGYEGQAT